MKRLNFAWAALGSLAIGTSAIAANINSMATGADMAGARVIVDWELPGGPVVSITGIWVASGPDSGFCTVLDPIAPAPGAGFAHFAVSGDTFVSNWIIDNRSDWWIRRVTFDLTPSISLYDDSPVNPDSPGSAAGRDSVVYDPINSSAPAHLLSDEILPWGDGKNLGDIWLGEFIEWAPAGAPGSFGAFTTYSYFDDTDTIPAPATVLMVAGGGMLASRRRR